MVKPWSSTQSVIALSSGEAELYALVKGAAQTLGAISMGQDFGVCLNGGIYSDSSAAIGITARQGLGKLRHINVQFLWIQDKIKSKELQVTKVAGEKNPADLLTKHLDACTMMRHLETLGLEGYTGRATTAPTLAHLYGVYYNSGYHYNGQCMESYNGHGGQLTEVYDGGSKPGLKICDSSAQCFTGITLGVYIRSSRHGGAASAREVVENLKEKEVPNEEVATFLKDENGNEATGEDEWNDEGECCVRLHRTERLHLFTPLRVQGSPPGRSLFSVRITEGVFRDNCEPFRRVDSWRCREQAHMSFGRPWIGATTFIKHCPSSV